MDTPFPYKKAKICSDRNLQTNVETVPKYNNRSFAKLISSHAMRCGLTFMSPNERYRTKYGQLKEVKDLA
jgi:hypothetical protein